MAKAKTINRTGMVGEWLLDGNALDSAGTNNGTATNVTFASTDRGMQSQCGVFNGSNSYITSTGTSSSTGTISMLVKFNSFTGTPCHFAGNEDTANSNNYFIFYTRSGTELSIYGGATGKGASTSGLSLSTGVWYNIIWRQDGTSLKLFLNGVEQDISSNGDGFNGHWGTEWFSNISGFNQFCIGALERGGQVYQPMNASIQSVRTYNYAISTQEIQTLYQEGLRQLSGQGYGSLMDGLVASYDFKGDAQDIIGGNNGTVSGATLTTDRFGNANSAYSFDGVNDYISCGNVLNLTGQKTIHALVNLSTLSGSFVYPKIIDKGGNTANYPYSLIMLEDPAQGANRYKLYFAGTAGGVTKNLFSNTLYTSLYGGVHLITCVYDGTHLRMYIDGVLDNSNNIGSVTFDSNSSNMTLMGGASSDYVSGVLDEVLFFNRAQTADEIKTLYQLSSTTPNLLPWKSNLPKSLQSGLVMWLNEQGKDLSGNGNHATLVNSPSVVRRIGEKGLVYNGSNQNLDIGKPFNNLTSGEFTCDIKINSASGAYIILGFRHSTTSTIRDGQFDVFDGKLRFIVHNGSGYFVLTSNKTLSTTKYHKITFKWDGTTKYIFIDGILDVSAADTTAVFNSAIDVGYTFGRIQVGAATWFNGNIINPQIYNIGRSVTEINQTRNGLYIK